MTARSIAFVGKVRRKRLQRRYFAICRTQAVLPVASLLSALPRTHDPRPETRERVLSSSPPNSPAMPSEATVAIAPAMEPMDKNSGRPAETKKPINKLKVFMGVRRCDRGFLRLPRDPSLSRSWDVTADGILFAIAAIMSLLVCANVGGQLICKVSGKFADADLVPHYLLAHAIGLSAIPIFDFLRVGNLCIDHDLEDYGYCEDLLGPMTVALIYVGLLVNVLRLITIGLMLSLAAAPPSPRLFLCETCPALRRRSASWARTPRCVAATS